MAFYICSLIEDCIISGVLVFEVFCVNHTLQECRYPNVLEVSSTLLCIRFIVATASLVARLSSTSKRSKFV